jgi:anti-sigma factor RsiW
MSFDADDVRLTAYALGELDPAGCAAVEAMLRDDPEAESFVAGIREVVWPTSSASKRRAAPSSTTPGGRRSKPN